jgi:hypothetical protein
MMLMKLAVFFVVLVDDVDETGCLFVVLVDDVDFPDSISMLAFVSNPFPMLIV